MSDNRRCNGEFMQQQHPSPQLQPHQQTPLPTMPGYENGQHDNERYTVFSNGYGQYLKVCPAMFSSPPTNMMSQNMMSGNVGPSTGGMPQMFHQATQQQQQLLHPHQQMQEPMTMFYEQQNQESFFSAPPMVPSSMQQNGQRDQQGNFFNQLVGNWQPGTSILGDRNNFEQDVRDVPEQFRPFNNNINNQQQQQLNVPQAPLQQQQERINQLNNYNSTNNNSGNKKPRVVAEVKPMRMSYSDVLSKNVAAGTIPPSMNSSSTMNTTPQSQPPNNGGKKNSDKKSANGEKKYDEKFRKSRDNAEKRSKDVDGTKPSVIQKESSTVKDNSTTSTATDTKTSGKKKLPKQKTKSKLSESDAPKGFAKMGHVFDSVDDGGDEEDSIDIEDDDGNASQAYDNVYNVRRNDLLFEKPKTKKVKSTTTGTTNANRSNSKQQTQDKAYKRQRGRKSQRYQMLEKIWSVWFEYIIKFIAWLWSLVSDVVYQLFYLITDRVASGYHYIGHVYESWRSELGCNTNRPSVWIKSLWSKFDARFAKESKWAFWRRSLKKPPEPVKDYYKDGKLPSTADEAMYSLLNCKGKDAYSILGVTPECSQEQIRKHYKKIAVLVHPDKNKQPGAEEAFKVLQRSFELIGEPVIHFE